jgi:hypothetical protein
VANGLGGYASGTVSGRRRRYHGLLIAAAAPLVSSHVERAGGRISLAGWRVVEVSAGQSQEQDVKCHTAGAE